MSQRLSVIYSGDSIEKHPEASSRRFPSCRSAVFSEGLYPAEEGIPPRPAAFEAAHRG